MTEFILDIPGWEAVLSVLKPGSSLPAARFLALMEQEGQEDTEQALALLEQKDVLLDVSAMPQSFGSGEMAVQLRREHELQKAGKLPEALGENDPLRLTLEEIAAVPACGDADVLAMEYRNGNAAAGKRLLDLLLGSAVQQALSMTGNGVLLLDLIQEASLGLWEAITSYAGGDIYSHCNRSVLRKLAAVVVLQARENGVGRKMRQATEDYRAVDAKLLAELGRNPTLEEIAQEMHISPQEAAAVEETLEAARLIERANAPGNQEPQPEDRQAVEDTAYFQMRQRIGELLSVLTGEDAELLTLRFGLEGGLPLSPEETGKKMNLTPEQVVQREAAALAKLRTNG